MVDWICWRYRLQAARSRVRQAQTNYEVNPSTVTALAVTGAVRAALLIMDQQPRRYG